MIIKLSAAFLIFLAGIISGLLPILSRDTKHSFRILYYGEYFARGIFLSAGIIHLLAESEKTFVNAHPHVNYPIIFAICVATIFILNLIEQCTKRYAQHRAYAQNWLPYLLLILLSIHSIITGAALGISTSLSQILIIFIAIISHKSAAAFSLGVNMRSHKISKKVMITLLMLFSLMTPIGIIASSIVETLISHHGASLAQAFFGAIAAGTFVYIGTFRTTRFDAVYRQNVRIIPTLYFGLGIAFMAVMAVFL